MKSIATGSRVTVLYGGFSSEREVSLVSGRQVSSALREMNYNVTLIDIPRNIEKMIDLLHHA